jgi:ABC-type sugar transport system ATPase subunit
MADLAKAQPEAHAEPAGDPDAILRVVGVSKSFGSNPAIRSASLEVRPGEVHAIVGENGCGKSTLVKILSGVHQPDSGSVELAGAKGETRLRSPREAIAAGIGTVFQEVLVVEARAVVENVWLGSEGLFRSGRARRERRDLAESTLARLLGDSPGLDLPVERLSLSDRQACGIARALVKEPRVLILDEATSALDISTRDRLFALLREYVARGNAVIFISHRMDEIEEIADRVTVMRSGETVGTMARSEADVDHLVRMMTGSDHLTGQATERPIVPPGAVILEVDGIEIRSGEVVGLAGLEGQGQERFLLKLRDAAGADGAYVPRDRRGESIFESKSVVENFALPTLREDTRFGLIRPGRSVARLKEFTAGLRTKYGRPDDEIVTLSGGNQQKIVVARWLATRPKVLLLNDPTRGVDLNAKRDLYRLLGDLVVEGLAIVMLSTEVDEHMELMDRVLVFHEDVRRFEFKREAMSREALVGGFFGEEVGHG